MANKIRLPTSEGGLVRYYDEDYQAKVVLKPEVVVALSITIIVLGILLAVYGSKWLGL